MMRRVAFYFIFSFFLFQGISNILIFFYGYYCKLMHTKKKRNHKNQQHKHFVLAKQTVMEAAAADCANSYHAKDNAEWT